GYETEPASDRKELSSAEMRYFKNCDPKNYQVTDEGMESLGGNYAGFNPQDHPVTGDCARPDRLVSKLGGQQRIQLPESLKYFPAKPGFSASRQRSTRSPFPV